MFKNIFIFIFGVLVTVQRGRTAITPLDAIDDAQAALNQLREATSTGLTNAFGIYANASQGSALKRKSKTKNCIVDKVLLKK
ncbi:hypothetical protein MTP99_001471 [Tenebrio molitor]|nr:hypothetical protein MTP99_001471 [Tenebrio molitor]